MISKTQINTARIKTKTIIEEKFMANETCLFLAITDALGHSSRVSGSLCKFMKLKSITKIFAWNDKLGNTMEAKNTVLAMVDKFFDFLDRNASLFVAF
jgi:hypothetical protein